MQVVLGIGDSWTQGEGGVPLHIFEERGGRIDGTTDEECIPFLKHEHENSWVNVLCRDYFTTHIPINLGMRGYGNRGAVKNLYIENYELDKITGGYLIFLLSSRVRFDVLYSDDYITGRRKFHTIYPFPDINEINDCYFKYYTDYFGKQETIFNILEAQTFAQAYNLTFYFASAFEDIDDLKEDLYGSTKLINWNSYLTPNTNYFTKLTELDGNPNASWEYYKKMKMPSKYITNCIHPTIAGYSKIADDMYKKIKIKNKWI